MTSQHLPPDSSPHGSGPIGGLGRTMRLLAAALTVTMVALVAADGAAAATTRTAAPARSATASAASNAFGTMHVSRVVGHARNGARFTGHFRPIRFVETRHHNIKAVGQLTGTLTRPSGAKRHISQRVRMPVNLAKSGGQAAALANGSTAGVAAAPPVCNILHLVLGPLDLNLLGLTVHLDKVVLNIVAVTGAGNLLGNLLCAVAGLLDGTGLLSTVLTTLNQILAALRT